MSIETWATIAFSLVFAFVAFFWKNLIEKRFEELAQTMKENHAELKMALEKTMTEDKCQIYHDAHDKEHERLERDLNALGSKLDSHIRDTK